MGIKEIGYRTASIYNWRRKYILNGTATLRNTGDDPRGKLTEGEPASSDEVEQLKSKMQDMPLEIDMLKETLEVLKKRPRHRYDSTQKPCWDLLLKMVLGQTVAKNRN